MAASGEQEFSTEIAASVDDCFATVADFEKYASWSGPVEKTKVMRRDRSKLARQVEFSVDMTLRTVRYVLEFAYERPTRVTWRLVEGDLESIEGSYVFEKLGLKRTRATCRQSVSVGFWVPGPIRSAIERGALRQSVLDFKTEVERRVAKKGRPRARRD